jgi:type II secretory pathway component PulK
VLILAVFAAALLLVLAVAVAASVRVELLASRVSLTRMQSLFLAEAGLSQARAVLLYDDPAVDTLLDSWGPESELRLDLPQQLGSGFYEVRVRDACGRIDVNEASGMTLARLVDDPAVAAAIMDWRDRGHMTSAGGAEQDFYAALHYPYAPRNGHLQSLGELLLVRGVTPDVFFGAPERSGLVDLLTVDSTSSNLDDEGRQRLYLNSFRNWDAQDQNRLGPFATSAMAKLGSIITFYEAQEIWHGFNRLSDAGRDGYTSLGQLVTEDGAHLDPTKAALLVDYVTVDLGRTASGKVNINTASFEVLRALAGSSAPTAQDIVERREEKPFEKRSEVARLLLNQPDGEAVFAQMMDWMTTKSSSFIIESMGWVDPERGFRTIRAVVRRSPEYVSVRHQVEQDWPLPVPDEARLQLN